MIIYIYNDIYYCYGSVLELFSAYFGLHRRKCVRFHCTNMIKTFIEVVKIWARDTPNRHTSDPPNVELSRYSFVHYSFIIFFVCLHSEEEGFPTVRKRSF